MGLQAAETKDGEPVEEIQDKIQDVRRKVAETQEQVRQGTAKLKLLPDNVKEAVEPDFRDAAQKLQSIEDGERQLTKDIDEIQKAQEEKEGDPDLNGGSHSERHNTGATWHEDAAGRYQWDQMERDAEELRQANDDITKSLKDEGKADWLNRLPPDTVDDAFDEETDDEEDKEKHLATTPSNAHDEDSSLEQDQQGQQDVEQKLDAESAWQEMTEAEQDLIDSSDQEEADKPKPKPSPKTTKEKKDDKKM